MVFVVQQREREKSLQFSDAIGELTEWPGVDRWIDTDVHEFGRQPMISCSLSINRHSAPVVIVQENAYVSDRRMDMSTGALIRSKDASQ